MSQNSQADVPDTGTQRGVEQEGVKLHAGKAGGYGDELAHGGYQSANEG